MNVLELRAEEPRRALVTMEMMLNHDRIHPTLNGEPYYHKPPLFNWVLEAAFRLTDSQAEWAVRLPSILAFLLTGALIFLLLRNAIDERTAGLAALIFLTCADPLFYGTVNAGEIDLFLTLPVFVQVIALPLFYRRRKWLAMFALSYACMAVVFLTKHFGAFAFQFTAILALVIATRNWRVLFRWQHFAGGGIFLLLVGGYFFAYSQEQDVAPFLANLFFETSNKSATGAWGERLLHLVEYPLTLLKLLAPWSLLLIFLWKKPVFAAFRQNEVLWFCLVFSLLNVGLYWLIPDTRDRYLYPLFPFWSVVLAVIFFRFTNFKLRTAVWVALALAIGRIVYNFAVMPLQQEQRHFRQDAKEILKLADGEPVHLTSWPWVRQVDERFLGVQIAKQDVIIPPEIPYAVPYYLTRETGQIVAFHPEPEPGKLYLAPARFLDGRNVEVLYTVEVGYISGGLVFCRVK